MPSDDAHEQVRREKLRRLVELMRALAESADGEELGEVAQLLVDLSGPWASGDLEQIAVLNDVGLEFHRAYLEFGVRELLDFAVQAAAGSVAQAPEPEDRALMALCASNFANSLRERYECGFDRNDLEVALQAARAGAAYTDPDHPYRGQHFHVLGNVSRNVFELNAVPSFLDEAILAYREAVTATVSADEPLWALAHSTLSGALRARYLLTRDREAIEEAVLAARAAVGAHTLDDSTQALALNNLGAALMSSLPAARGSGAAADPLLDEAIAAYRSALGSIPEGDARRAMLLSNLGLALSRKHLADPRPELFAEATARAEAALALIPQGHPQRARYRCNVGLVLHTEFEANQDPAALSAAVRALAEAVAELAEDGPGRAEYVHRLASARTELFPYTGDRADLDHAIALHRESIQLTAAEQPQFHSRISELALALMRRGTVEDLVEAQQCFREALAASAPPDESDRAWYLANLGVALREYHVLTSDAESLDEALTVAREALESTPRSDRARPQRMVQLAVTLNQLNEATGNADVLDEAVALAREAAEATPPGHRMRGMILSNDCLLLHQLFTRSGDPADLDEAVDAGLAALAEGDGETLAGAHVNLAVALYKRFESRNDDAALDESIRSYEAALAAGSLSPSNQAAILASLGTAKRSRAEINGDLADLADAVALCRRAVGLAGPNDSRRGLTLLNLGGALLRSFELSGEPAVFDEALETARAAVEANRAHPELHFFALSNFGAMLRYQYEQAADPTALDEALRLGRKAVEGLPDRHYQRAAVVYQLGLSLVRAHDRTGDIGHLREAERRYRDLIATAGAHWGGFAVRSNVGDILRHLADRTGDEPLVREAVQHCRDAVGIAPPDHPSRGALLANLGNALASLFDWTDEREILEESVRLLREAVALASESTALARALRHIQLSRTLQLWYTKTGELPALEEAVEKSREAVSALPADFPQRGMYLATHGLTLDYLGGATGDAETIRASARILREALGFLAPGSQDYALCLGNLGISLRRQAEAAGSTATAARAALLTESADALRRTVDLLASENPARTRFQLLLGMSLLESARDGDETARADARGALAEVRRAQAAPVLFQMVASSGCAQLELAAGSARTSLARMEDVAELLPRYASRGWPRIDREGRLGRLNGLAAEAAAIAVAAGMPERAVELLEQTRGLLLNDAIDDRADIAQLHAVAPSLAAELSALRERTARLERAEPSFGGPAEPDEARVQHGMDASTQRRELATQWTVLLDRIRALSGFADFLRPPGIDRLLRQTRPGPIVQLYAGETRAGALILRAAEPRVQVVELPGLTETGVDEQLKKLHAALAATKGALARRRRGEQELHEVLEWLWTAVAGPVLDELGSSDTDEPAAREGRGEHEELPRIWWCPVGLLALLPIHAAGLHREAGGRTVFDRVVSSYTPTIRSLEHARARIAPTAASSLLVSMPEAPDAHTLDGVASEAETLAELLPNPLRLSGCAATHRAVADALTRHPIAHFACHALSDPAVPASSRLLLHDHREAPLTVASLMRLDLAHAELAYLSACSTTETSPALTDEAVHLSGALHMAGYRQVIGTLWPVDDGVAAQVAGRFYAELRDLADGRLVTGHGARALADVTRALREDYRLTPSLWAPYLHFGV